MEDEKLSYKVWALPNVVKYQQHNGTSLVDKKPYFQINMPHSNDHLELLNFVRETKKTNAKVPTMPLPHYMISTNITLQECNDNIGSTKGPPT